MNKIKKYSIIIPVYNGSKHIQRCVDSIINQQYDDYEIIIVDDKSTDDTVKKINLTYCNNDDINLIQLDNNNGPGYARNIGIQKAIGQYILFVDADDYVSNNYFATLNKAIDNDNCFDIMYFLSNVNRETVAFGNMEINLLNDLLIKRLISDNNINYPLTFPHVYLCVYKAAFLKAHNIAFINEYYMEDILFSIDCFTKAKNIKYCKTRIYNRTIRTRSLMTSCLSVRQVNSVFKSSYELYKRYIKKEKVISPEWLLEAMFDMRKHHCEKCIFKKEAKKYLDKMLLLEKIIERRIKNDR